MQSEKEVFPFSVDDKDDVEMKGPKSSSSASSVCSNQNDKMASDSTNVSGANDDEKKATEVMDVDQISASEKRRESNDNKCNPLDNKNFVQTSDSASSLFNPATDGKDENPNAVKTEIKEEEDAAAGASGTVKSKAGNANNFSTQRLQHAVSKHPVSLLEKSCWEFTEKLIAFSKIFPKNRTNHTIYFSPTTTGIYFSDCMQFCVSV